MEDLPYVNSIRNFELLFRDIPNLVILSNEDLDYVKMKTKRVALSSTSLKIKT